MKLISYYSTILDKYIIHILNLISLLFIFRGSIPAFKYPFILLYTVVIFNFVFTKKARLLDIVIFLKSNLLIIVLVLYFVVALLTTYKIYLEIFKELINTLVLLSITYFFTIIVSSERQLKMAFSSLINWIIILSSLIAIIWISDFFHIFLPNNDGVRLMDYHIVDYNFATLPALFGIVSILFMMSGVIKKTRLYPLTFLLLLFYLQLFLSTSRRSFILSITILFLIFFIFIISFFLKREWLSNFARRISPFLLTIISIFLSGYLFVTQTTFEYKTALFKKIGLVNGVAFVNEITEKSLRIVNIFDPEKTISELVEEVWAPDLDPKDPESGWGRRIHKTVFPLSGINSHRIPAGVKGYMMDKTCDAIIVGGNPYSITKVDMDMHLVPVNDVVRSSIFCFVSEDYDGDDVFMVLSNKENSWIGYASYDLKKKGIWQELVIQMPVSSRNVSTYIYFTKRGVSDFSNLSGQVIFAYPQFVNLTQSIKNLDPKDPESGWGHGIYKTIYPLSGKNSSLIPEGVKGYMMDKTCNAVLIEGNPYSYTNVDMKKNLVSHNDTVKSSIFCFVSEDYDGDDVFMVLSNKENSWIGYSSYNLESKGIWQELVIQMPVSCRNVSTNIYFTKKGAVDFSNLRGYVIFAYPQFINLSQQQRDSIRTSVDSNITKEISLFNYKQESNGSFGDPIISSFIHMAPLYSQISWLNDGDPIRNLMTRIFPEDTTYIPYKHNFQINPISNKIGEDRLIRWIFAGQIFISEYNLKKKLFGGGFNFLNWYGNYFLNDKTATDYPHNPFLSVLLYSGIFGLIIYCFFLYKVFYYYIKYIKEYPLLFIFFLITFFFNFFSGSSPFDHPIMGFFSILPFFIHSIHKKDRELALCKAKDTAS